MAGFGVLTGLLVLPLVGAALILALRGEDADTLRNAKWIALVASLATFALSLVAWSRFDPSKAGFQLLEVHRWIAPGIAWRLGVDGISMPFVLLTTFLTPFCFVASWKPIEKRVKAYLVAFLVLETLMIGVFVALDLVLFYLFFEGGLIPMFLIIGIWG
ncbi:MAG: NADH-quinone oxidoreductase subunit M, partial [Hyphomicrobiales bacterium]|nr:NADH-quinone oxidoreductase subunit M [Hyphomicrobiales bacterium]